MDKIIEINKWSEVFESANSRKRQRLGFYYMPSGCDSAGYLALVSEFEPAEAWQAYGIFVAMCQQAATMKKDVRGKFINNNNQPMTTRQIAMLIRCDHDILIRSLEILMDTRIAWISASDVPPICHSSATSVPQNSGFVIKDKVKEEGKGEGKGEGEGQETVATLPFDSLEFTDAWNEWQTYLKQKRKTPTELTTTKQLKQLSTLTEQDAIKTLDQSIQNGWQGLFPTKHGDSKSNNQDSGRSNRGSAGDGSSAGDGINVPIL